MPPKRQGKKKDPLAGVPPDARETIQQILGSYQPRQNGPPGADLARLLMGKSPDEIDKIVEAFSHMQGPDVDIDTFDYTKVSVKRNSFWVMQLSPDGFVDKNGRHHLEYQPDSQPNFDLMIYDETSSFRVVDNPPPGMPSTEFLLKSLKRSIASPLPPIRPGLSELLIIAYKLGPHVDGLRPFLNSLPEPFSWRLETPEEAEEVASGVHEKNEKGVKVGLSSAQQEKSLGNDAVARKDREAAVKHYSEAIECLVDALSQNPTKAQEITINELLSVCYANRAAAWLMEAGHTEPDPKKALKDAEEAIKWNVDYSKAYYRQAKSYHVLGERDRAIEVLKTALARQKLKKDKGLNDFFKQLSDEAA